MQNITKRTYKNNDMLMDGDNFKNDVDDAPGTNPQDLTPDNETRAGVSNVYIYHCDAPDLRPDFIAGLSVGDKCRKRSNFRIWTKYVGVQCSDVYNWWEAQSLEITDIDPADSDRDRTYDDANDDDDDDDNNVGWNSRISLTKNMANAGNLDHFNVLVISPQTKGQEFVVIVIAEDSDGNIIINFTGTVSFSQTGGTAGSEGPPKAGVHINNTANTGDDVHVFVGSDCGVYSFRVIDYTAETITKFTATGGGKTGESGSVIISE